MNCYIAPQHVQYFNLQYFNTCSGRLNLPNGMKNSRFFILHHKVPFPYTLTLLLRHVFKDCYNGSLITLYYIQDSSLILSVKLQKSLFLAWTKQITGTWIHCIYHFNV